MRHNVRGRKLNRNSAHRRALMKNMTTNLFKYGSIRTTLAKAKETRPYAEKLITRAISGSLTDKRVIISKLNDKKVAHHLLNSIAPELTDRKGGYLRIVKLGNREGDGAEMAVLEIVSDSVERKKSRKKLKNKSAKSKKKSSQLKAKKAEDKDKEHEHEHEKVHPKEERTKEHLSSGSPAEGVRNSSKPPKTMKPKGDMHNKSTHPKTPPPSSKEN